MADVADVESALVSLVSATIYPSGTGNPSAIGASARVYRGWPDARKLDADLAAGVLNVTVFPERGTRRTTRYPHISNPAVIPTPTITASTAEPKVTFAGAAGVAALAGIRVNGGAFSYAVQAADTPAAVATALGAVINAGSVPGITASVVGAAVTVTPSTGLLGRVVGVGTQLTEVRRQAQRVRVTVWAPSVALRDAAAGLVDAAIGSIDWLTLADGTGGRILYVSSFTDDVPSKDALWRRDLCYEVEYPTTFAQAAFEMLFGGGDLTNPSGTLLAVAGDVFP